MNLNQWYEKGMTYQDYVESMNVNKEKMLSIYDRFQFSQDEKTELTKLGDLNHLRVIALTEDWCGDAMLNNPILMKIAEALNFEVRFLLRDKNLELMDQYLTNGKSRSIPIYIFISQEGQEVAVWGPRAQEIQQFVMEERSKLPAQDSPEFQEKQKEIYKGINEKFLNDENFWHIVAESILTKIKSSVR